MILHTLFGIPNESLLNRSENFLLVYILSGLWQTIGWNSIIYLSALAGIDQELYDAAKVDGAGRFKQVLHVVSASFSNPADYVRHEGLLLRPVNFCVDAYRAVAKNRNILTGYANTIFIVAVGTVLSVVMSLIAAYCLSRRDVMWNRFLIIAVICLYYAVSYWNAWFNAMLFIRDRAGYPLQLILREILIQNDTSAMSAGEDYLLSETIQFATIVVSTLPILTIYPFIQKYFVKGVMIGAVKG